MIRGPVLPQLRDSLWSLVSSRLDRIETGLTLVLESLDCSDGELGTLEGLARDSAGGAVLVMLAVEGDALLPARALSAGQFLERVGDALVRAVPEANFCPGVPGRVLLVGTESAAAAIQRVCALPIAGLHACTLEPFRVAGRERFAVRWLATSLTATSLTATSPMIAESAVDRIALEQAGLVRASDGGLSVEPAVAGSNLQRPEFVVPPQRTELWEAVVSICERIDSAVIIHGDRFSRSITWNGNSLGDVRTVGGALVASSATGVVRDLRDQRDVRRFGDQLLRAYVRHAELDLDLGGGSGVEQPVNGDQFSSRSAAFADSSDRFAATRHAVGDRRGSSNGESLRSSLAAAKLSPEEYSALGDPALVAGPITEGSVANDRP
ncbi:MAG: hypothetical protein ACI89X_002275 [Planctomycetota bacterium]|jgi:hypothetical protein